MADAVELAFRRAARRLLDDVRHILVGVSGGGDSVALLHLLRRFARRSGWTLTVAHLDHGLRRGSKADRRFVETLARSLDLPCVADRQVVSELRRRGESPEEAARRVRRRFLVGAAAEAGAEAIAVGHTLDDQAETVLLRLVRGAGSAGLKGMVERGPGPFVRPLLQVEREALRRWLGRRGLDFREDPTNRDLRYDRNRVRRRTLPELESVNPGAARHLVAAAERLRIDADCLGQLAARAAERIVSTDRRGRVVLDAVALAELHPALAVRVAGIALTRLGLDSRRVGAAHLQAVVDLAHGPGGRQAHLPGRSRARRIRQRLVLESS